MKLAHVINPVKVNENSDLYFAQPITFAAVKAARETALQNGLDVELYSVSYPEDFEIVPPHLHQLENLNRSCQDVSTFERQRKLPLIKDILDHLDKEAKADYFIYTNVDIAVQPQFYLEVSKLIDQGYDSFVINRRTISEHYTDPGQLHLMYSEKGDSHPGHDCFVFSKEQYKKFVLENTCIGINWIGRVILWNQYAVARNFHEFKDLYLTFHVGNDKVWKNPAFSDYVQFNYSQAFRVFEKLNKKYALLKRLEDRNPEYLTALNRDDIVNLP